MCEATKADAIDRAVNGHAACLGGILELRNRLKAAMRGLVLHGDRAEIYAEAIDKADACVDEALHRFRGVLEEAGL